MIWLDTKEEVDMDSFFEALENREVFLVSRTLTEKDKEELSKAIADYKAMHPKTPVKEAVLA